MQAALCTDPLSCTSLHHFALIYTTRHPHVHNYTTQEGHTAFATQAEADTEVRQILDFYAGALHMVLPL